MEKAWPLVGRDEELRFVRERLEGPAGTGAVLAGEAGCGKTRLALELLDHARESGWTTVLVIAHQATSEIPLAAFAHLLDAADLDTQDPLRLLTQAHRALERLRTGERLLLVVDDAQHLDPQSAALVHQEAASGTSVLATLRTPASVPEPVATLWKEGLAERVELQPLTWADVQDVLERALGGKVDGSTLRRLWTASRGNVMYLRELVSGGVDSGVLRRRGNAWVWQGDVVAPRLADLVACRLTDLSEPEVQALGYLALCEPMRAGPLSDLVDGASLAGLEHRGLVEAREEAGELVVRLAHPLYGEVLRERMSPLDALATKRRVVEVLTRTHDLRRGERISLALWSVELGEAADPHVLLQAASETIDPTVGERLARAAAQAGGGLGAQRLVAAYLDINGRSTEAQALIESLDDGATETASLANAHAWNLYYGLGRELEAMEVLRAAEDSDLGPSAKAQLVLQRAAIHLDSGRTAEALTTASGALDDLAEPRPSVVRLATTVCAIGFALQGRAAEAIATVDEGMAAADPHDEARWAIQTGNLMSARYLASWLAGDLDDAAAVAEAGYELFSRLPRPEYHGLAALGLGRVALSRGQVQTAARRLDEACVLFREVDPGGYLRFALSGLAQAKALAGSAPEAQAAVEEIDRLATAVRLYDADVALARAWTAAAGAPERASALAVEAADIAVEMDHRAFELVALHDAVRLGAGGDVAERLVERAPGVEGAFSRARREHAAGVLTREPGPVERASGVFEAAGALLQAAECAAHAAHLYTEAGRGRQARAATARAQAVAARCQGARTPMLWRAGQHGRLTRREQEVAQLATQGRSNQEIAEELVVSIRTVENHLHQAYAKLGVQGRADLATVLHDAEPVAT